MEDLSTLSKSLHEILSSPEGGESLASTVEGYLSSSELSTKKAVCETLLELLNEGDDDTRSKRREAILSETSLTYLPLLLPLSTSIPSAKEIIVLIAGHSKSREVVLGLTEDIQSILDRAEGFQVSDDEDGFENEEEIEVDWPSLIGELQLIITCLATAIPKLPNSKSTPTLLSLSESISSSLPILSHQSSTTSARKLLGGLCELIEIIWDWVQNTTDKGGEQRAIVSNLLFESITLLGHRVNAKLTERWFLNTFPKFSGLQNSQELIEDGVEGWKEGQEVLAKAWSTASILNFKPSDFLQKIIDPSHLTVHASLACLNLLSSQIVHGNWSSILPSPISPSLIDDSMSILTAALSGSSVDAGIVYTWGIVHESLNNKAKTSESGAMEYDNASMLLELLVPLTAQHPSSLLRLALFKLIGGIISFQSSVTSKLELFKQLLEPANPFDNIRIQSLSLLRESVTSQAVLSPLLIEIIFPILFISSSDQDPEDNPLKYQPSELVNSPYITWWTECLTFLWFLLDFDKDDITTIHQITKNGKDGKLGEWLGDVERKLKELQEFQHQKRTTHEDGESGGDEFSGLDFAILRFEDSLNRVKQAFNS